jgi:glycerophosphoryl diester phosphodiesterase
VTLIYAHRGASGYAPENTVAAFDRALEMPIDGIETDIRSTKDGVLVLLHDAKV